MPRSGPTARSCFALHQLHILQTEFGSRASPHLKHARFVVQTYDRSLRTHPIREEVEDSKRPASDVDCAPARLHSDLIQQPNRLGFVRRTLPD